MSAFASAIAQGLDSIGQLAGESIVYSRGAQSVTLTAVPGVTGANLDDAGINVSVLTALRDWIIKADDLVIGGSAVMPKRGDRITAGGLVYEVNVDGEQVYHWSDPGHTRLRVHTKQIDEVTP